MKIPYAMVAAVDTHRRHAQMALALQHGWPRLKQEPMDDRKVITIACYGPSLEQTWQTMKRPILSMSGATRWLALRGLIPDYHLDMDPRQHKIRFLDPPIDGVHYLMATVCHPDTWRLLKGQHVTLWHTYSDPSTYEWVKSMDPGELVIHGGSTIGLSALHVAGVMGYRHFEIHGMDGCFADETRTQRHAGFHGGTKQSKDGITWDVNRKTYYTSRIMANAVSETINALSAFPMFCVFHGEGLTQALVRENNVPTACCADETEKADRLRRSTAHIMDMLITDQGKVNLQTSAWDVLCGPNCSETFPEMERIRNENEPRRARANYNTGTVTLEQMAQLRGICVQQKPKVIVELGTFIGNSAMAMQAERIYTCDRSNDCFPSTETIHTFPRRGSTEMLGALVERGVKADMFFFDGRIEPADVPLILRLSHAKTLYVFDDYNLHAKGVVNAKIMASVLPSTQLMIEPDSRLAGKSTLAAIVPVECFQS